MLSINKISFSYNLLPTVKNISFTVKKGETLVVIGKSGCGKSTLLKLIFGLYDLDSGSISWNDIEVTGPKYNLIPGMPFIKHLSQDFDLMPFITVEENVGKHLSNFYPEQKQERINELLDIVEMTDYAKVKVKHLSGGQMQRVAIARVLALEPEVLLLDEHFSSIDNFLKNSLRRKFFKYLKQKNITCIVATHDSTDVMSFSDEVLVMKEGKVIKKATAVDLYNNPESLYVASLFGDVNEIPSKYLEDLFSKGNKFIYPDKLIITDYSNLKVKVISSYFNGFCYLIEASYFEGTLYFNNDNPLEIASEVYLKIKPQNN